MQAFNDVWDDTDFVGEADPMIRSAMERVGGAQILQDISLDTYWANTVGKTKYPGNYQLYKRELKQNMHELMNTKMPYSQMEEFMVVLGYETGDIREIFQEVTGLDPSKLELQRQEDVNNTPANIPWYNLGWGWSKKKGDAESYFVMQGGSMMFTIFAQVDDMSRKEVAQFLTLEQSLEYMKALVSNLHRYDKPVGDLVGDAFCDVKEESRKKEYQVMANAFYEQSKKGILDVEATCRTVADAVYSGTLTEAEGKDLIEIYAGPPASQPEDGQPGASQPDPPAKASPDNAYRQDQDVMDEVRRVTPDDFFKSVLPDRMDTIAPEHVQEVLTYISHRESDMSEFEVKLHSLEYLRHETPKALIEQNPENGRPAGPPRATISVIVEIADKTMEQKAAKKYGLLVFFVSPDGEVGTSDSVKGEDDVIYGFTEEGLQQYFSSDRMKRGAPEA